MTEIQAEFLNRPIGTCIDWEGDQDHTAFHNFKPLPGSNLPACSILMIDELDYKWAAANEDNVTIAEGRIWPSFETIDE